MNYTKEELEDHRGCVCACNVNYEWGKKLHELQREACKAAGVEFKELTQEMKVFFGLT